MRSKLSRTALGLLAMVLAPQALPAQDSASVAQALSARISEVRVFVGARILCLSPDTLSGKLPFEIERGVLVVREGRIAAVGPASEIEIPVGAQVRDVSGLWILPGLVDTHSHIGSGWGADSSSPIQADVRVLDSIDARAASIQKAQAGGITTANVMPGSGHLLSGQTLYLKLRDADSVEQMLVRLPDASIAGGVKMANGTNSRGQPPFPGTRAKSYALVREEFIKAQEYRAAIERAAGDAAKLPARDLGLEMLVELLEGKRIVHYHSHRHDDIASVLRLKQEFGLRVVLHHVSEGWKMAEEIAASGTPCSVIVVDAPGGKLEARDLRWETSAILDQAGVLVGLHTDDWITDSRLFTRSAGLAQRAGLSREHALAALTLNGARMLDLEQRIGSLEAGKDADFVLFDGDPLSVYTQVQETWVEGTRVFDRSDARDLLWATGGFGAGHERDFHGCCEGPNSEER